MRVTVPLCTQKENEVMEEEVRFITVFHALSLTFLYLWSRDFRTKPCDTISSVLCPVFKVPFTHCTCGCSAGNMLWLYTARNTKLQF
jgi:hypothetical protein